MTLIHSKSLYARTSPNIRKIVNIHHAGMFASGAVSILIFFGWHEFALSSRIGNLCSGQYVDILFYIIPKIPIHCDAISQLPLHEQSTSYVAIAIDIWIAACNSMSLIYVISSLRFVKLEDIHAIANTKGSKNRRLWIELFLILIFLCATLSIAFIWSPIAIKTGQNSIFSLLSPYGIGAILQTIMCVSWGYFLFLSIIVSKAIGIKKYA